MTPITINVTEKNDAWISFRVESGDFGNASEYIGDLIRRDQERQAKIDGIRQALIEGEESGVSEVDPEEIINRVLK